MLGLDTTQNENARGQQGMHGLNEPVIQTHGITKLYGEVQALKPLDLSVTRNPIFGFLGSQRSRQNHDHEAAARIDPLDGRRWLDLWSGHRPRQRHHPSARRPSCRPFFVAVALWQFERLEF